MDSTDRTVRHPNRLFELRNIRNLSQKEVAQLVGMTQPTVNRHENGNRSLDGFAIERYAKLYAVSPYEIFVERDHVVEYSDSSDESESPVEMVAV